MTDAFLITLELIRQKVNEVNHSIETIEKRFIEGENADLAKYVSNTASESSFLLKWIRQKKTPKTPLPEWHSLTSTMEMQRVLSSEKATEKELYAALNLYVLNSALIATKRKADEHVIQQVNELAALLKAHMSPR
jgi:pyruvate dehydrogenase complex dehydrogenase (E1) component